MDFFSIGTNDLTQYTLLAVDRQNGSIGAFCNPIMSSASPDSIYGGASPSGGHLGWHLRRIGKADPSLTQTFVEMGIDELSMSPGKILETKARILDRA